MNEGFEFDSQFSSSTAGMCNADIRDVETSNIPFVRGQVKSISAGAHANIQRSAWLSIADASDQECVSIWIELWLGAACGGTVVVRRTGVSGVFCTVWSSLRAQGPYYEQKKTAFSFLIPLSQCSRCGCFASRLETEHLGGVFA